MGCLAAFAAVAVITVVVDVMGLSLMDSVAAGTATTAEAESYDALNGNVALLYFLVYVASAVAYVAWLSRGVENAPALGAGIPPRSPRGAIGWWFVPFANFWIPCTIVRDLHGRLGAPGAPTQRGLLMSWWIMWLVISFVGNVAGRLWVGADTVDSLRSAMGIDLVSAGLDAIAAILALLVVRSIQAREDGRAQAIPLLA